MKVIILSLFLCITNLLAQNNIKVNVLDAKTKEPLIGANVFIKKANLGGATDQNGFTEIKNIPNGDYSLSVKYVGYESYETDISFPLSKRDTLITVFLKSEALKTQAVVVSATRNNGIVKDIPLRVEVLGQDEVNEEIAIRPGNISKLLGETSGIQVQQTSVASGNVSFRLEGLPGDYTQLLKDGFPIFSGISSGLSLLQIPPLDLQQVEVIKGSNSTLYGDGAIAGIVNLVSKKPSQKSHLDLILNHTFKNGNDVSSYYSNSFGKLGVTLLSSQSFQDPIDVDGDGFTDIPKFSQTTLNPKLFYNFNETTSLMFGMSTFFENRKGGDILAIKNGIDTSHNYIETNKSKRLTTQLKFEKQFNDGNTLTFKNTYNYYNRIYSVQSNFLNGFQNYSYSELSYLIKTYQHSLVTGINFITDSFISNISRYDYSYFSLGIFAQDDWKLNNYFIFQPGIRFDYHNKYNLFVIPHIALLYKMAQNLSLRLSGGIGYRVPSFLSIPTDNEIFNFSVNSAIKLPAEKSNSLNFDFNYIFYLNEFIITLNQAVFYTSVNNVINDSSLANNITYSNIETKGFDTNLTIALDELSLFVDYTYNSVYQMNDGKKLPLELTPNNKLNLTLSYEEEGEWRSGIEAFYTGRQNLINNLQSRDYWVFGFMIEKYFKSFSLIANIENIFDTRQTKWSKIVNPPITNPTFNQIWAPLDGVVANLALHINLN